MERNLYEILGLTKEATLEEIKSAYKARAKVYHPDKEGGDEELMKELTMSYEVLSDTERRSLYDTTGRVDNQSRAAVVEQIMVQMFMQSLQGSSEELKHKDIVKKAKGVAYETITGQRRSIKSAKEELVSFEEVLKRLSAKGGGPNILAAHVQGLIESVKGSIIEMEQRLAILEEVHKLFDNYQYSFDEPDPKATNRMSFYDL